MERSTLLQPTALTVRGGLPVYGQVSVAGFKHVLVLALPYLIGSGRSAVLDNVPDILETRTYLELLPGIGVPATWRDREFRISATRGRVTDLPEIAADIHGSLYLLPALLARHGEVGFSAFGGCPIGGGPGGGRPWRHAVRVLERFGARLFEDDGGRRLVTDGLRAAEVDLLEFTTDASVLSGAEYSGATKTAVLAAALATGTSVLRHPYAKFEVLRLLDLLESVGVPVARYPDRWEIGPAVADAAPVRATIPPDLLEVVTWVTVSALTRGQIQLSGVSHHDIAEGLAAESALWRSVGIELRPTGDDTVSVHTGHRLGALGSVEVDPRTTYSDSQPLFAALSVRCPGPTRIIDRVWGNRFGYLDGFRALGVDAVERDGEVVVGAAEPQARPEGVDVRAGDLRTAAALLCTALTTRGGPVTLHGAQHLDRGYDSLVDKLRKCHADLIDQTQDQGDR